jgi:uncharacterized membrane protein HdeD (DUF308 family)
MITLSQAAKRNRRIRFGERIGAVNYADEVRARFLADVSEEVRSISWLWILKGILAIAFGIAAWVWPDLTLNTLVWLFGAYLVVDGIFEFVGIFTLSALSWGRRILMGIWGVAEIAAGIIIWASPDLGVITLMVAFGIWAMITGTFLLVSAVTSDGNMMSPWLQALIGIAGIIVGIYLVVEPGDGAVATVWALGVTAIVYGVLSIVGGIQLRGSLAG